MVNGKIYDEEADLNKDGFINGFDHIKACQEWKDKYDRESFIYDFNGNRNKLIQNTKEYKYTYGTQNKLIKIEKSGKILIEYAYDNNGNTIKKTEYNDNNTKTIYDYRYDINNRLLEVKKNGIITASYIYDNGGMRLFKNENNKRTYYFRNGGTVFYEVEISDASNDVTENTYIISGELIAGRITRTNSQGDVLSYYHLDHLNSTKLITNKEGQKVLEYEYRAFGTELDKVGTDKNKFSYIGREFDDEINLYYLNARYYDATIGRFINVDPIQSGPNWYVYCNNNPLSAKDPTGLEAPNVRITDDQLETYRLRVNESETLWKPHKDYTHEDTFWFYGYYGGVNYNAGTFPDQVVLNNLQLFNTVKSLNSVDETFRRHDWNSIDKKTMQFVDKKSHKALIADYALSQDLQDIIDNGRVTDTITGLPLPDKENKEALDAAGQAKWAFKSVIKGAEKAEMERNQWTKEQFNEWRNSAATQKEISDARNVKIEPDRRK